MVSPLGPTFPYWRLLLLSLLLHLYVFDFEAPHPLHPFVPHLKASAAAPVRASFQPAPPADFPCPFTAPAAFLPAALGALTAKDGAALRVFPASQLGSPPTRDPHVGASEELCVLLAVQQPEKIAAWLQREMDLPYLMPNENNDVYPALASAGAANYHHVGLPDDVLFRLASGDAEVFVNVSLGLLTPAEGAPAGSSGGGGGGAAGGRGWWAAVAQLGMVDSGFTFSGDPPLFTAYWGRVDRDALARLRGAIGPAAARVGAPLPARLAVHVEHPLWSWNSGPRRSLYPCSGEGNPACGAWDDVGSFNSALGPFYAPLTTMAAAFDVDFEGGGGAGDFDFEGGGGAGAGGGSALATGAKRGSPSPGRVQCATATTGYWTREASNGTIALREGGPYWRPTGCHAVPFTNAQASACMRSRYPNAMLLGDSHMRRHFKDLMGRSATLLDWYSAPIRNVLAGTLPKEPTEHGLLVEKEEARIVAAFPGLSYSMWCHGREEDWDCTCSDAAHGPCVAPPPPLT